MKKKIGSQLSKSLHRRLKLAAVQDDKSMDDLLELAVQDFLSKKRRGKSIYHRLCDIEDRLENLQSVLYRLLPPP